MDFVDFVVIQGEPGDFAQSGEGALGEDWDVVLAEVEMLQLPAVAERQGGYFWQPVEILYSIFKFVKKKANYFRLRLSDEVHMSLRKN